MSHEGTPLLNSGKGHISPVHVNKRETLGYLLMACSAICFSAMTLLVKLSSQNFSSMEIVFFRSLAQMLLGFLGCSCFKLHPFGKKRLRNLIFFRALAGSVALALFFYTISTLPVSVATVIYFLCPIFTSILARVVLGEEFSFFNICAALLAFTGVVLISYARSSAKDNDLSPMQMFPVICGLLGAMLASVASVIVRKAGTDVHFLVHVSNFGIISTIFSFVGMLLSGFVMPRGSDWFLLASVGLLAFLGQCQWNYGLQLAPAGPATVFGVTQVVYAFMIDIFFFKEIPTFLSLCETLQAGNVVNSKIQLGKRQVDDPGEPPRKRTMIEGRKQDPGIPSQLERSELLCEIIRVNFCNIEQAENSVWSDLCAYLIQLDLETICLPVQSSYDSDEQQAVVTVKNLEGETLAERIAQIAVDSTWISLQNKYLGKRVKGRSGHLCEAIGKLQENGICRLNNWLIFNVNKISSEISMHLESEVYIDGGVVSSSVMSDIATFRMQDLFYFLFPYDIHPTTYANEIEGAAIRSLYDALQPKRFHDVSSTFELPHFNTTLMPFQHDSVLWMLRREGASISKNSKFCKGNNGNWLSEERLPPCWERIGSSPEPLLVNRLTGAVCRDIPSAYEMYQPVRGGILAEEVGLGKTVEILALTLLHPPDKRTKDAHPIGGTLIICPPNLVWQWISEIGKHAPTLRTFVYSRENSKDITPQSLCEYDIVLTTYATLQKEFHYREKKERPRRHAEKYEWKLSPLLSVKWWRTCLDEAQMVDRTTAQTAQLAHMIPRFHAWCVTGTPCKQSLDDLHGLFYFLDIYPLNNVQAWNSLALPVNRHILVQCLRPIFNRNTKAMVRDQLFIPPQHHDTLWLKLTKIERRYYDDLCELFNREVDIDGLDNCDWRVSGNGVDQTESEWLNSSKAKLRSWLRRLRQACCHPQIGVESRNILGTGYDLQTLDKVLKAMYRQTMSQLYALERSLYYTKWKRGFAFEKSEQFQEALAIYLSILVPIHQRITELTEQKDTQPNTPNTPSVNAEPDQGTPSAESAAMEVDAMRLHDWLLLEHQVTFFAANVNHQLKNEEEETKYYDKAEEIRRTILRAAEQRANQFIGKINPEFDHDITASFAEHAAGLLSWDIIERADDLSELLNSQAIILQDWRSHIIDGLGSRLVEREGDATGEEYQKSLEIQEELEIYLDVYSKALADRRRLIEGYASYIVREEPVSTRARQFLTEPELALNEKKKELNNERLKFVKSISFSTLLAQLAVQKTKALRLEEEEIIRIEEQRLRREMKNQKAILAKLEKESTNFGNIFNARVAYYRQLQDISDTVTNPEFKDPLEAQQKLLSEEIKIEKEVHQLIPRRRYLESLMEEEAKDKSLTCIICRCEYSSGYMTACGHRYCEDCTERWLFVRKRCAMCAKMVGRKDVWKIACREYTPTHREPPASELSSQQLLASLSVIEINGGYGTKIDTLVRHLKYIQQQDPGAKSLVFSQWSRLLSYICIALGNNNIQYVLLERQQNRHASAVEKFMSDPNTHVMCLHSMSQSSGLTLIDARYIIFFEPLVNMGLEQQAIGRVHRIGQTKETFVWWYVVEDSIEDRVYRLHQWKKNKALNKIEGTQLTEPEEEEVPQTTVARVEKNGLGELVLDEDLRFCFSRKLEVK
ncbi:uncharacterized protein VTP21DRAFT_4056 [Calcarisporiella thermophila]|uniref:uncharacterized protein n=1 Tax=Calcarisporiella thermophila TaxID=911321 RepID=UPI003743A62C